MRRAIRWSVFLVGAVGACAAPTPVVTSRPVVEAPVAPPVDPLSPPWIPQGGAGPVRQTVRFETELRSRVDTVVRSDSILVVLAAEWSRVRGDGAVRISGLLTDYRVGTDTGSLAPPTGLSVPLPFAMLDGDEPASFRPIRSEPAECGIDAAATQAVREVLLSLPRRLQPETRWQDSASYAICRDSVPLVATSVRAYRVVGAARRADGIVIEIERRSRLTLRGEGRQFNEPLTIEAAGEGTATLFVRLVGGAIAEGTGETTLRMTMRGRRRSQELTQHTRIAIVSAP